MNLKPAPFELTDGLVAIALGARPALSTRVLHIPVLPTKLVDEVAGLACAADVPAVLRADCTPPEPTLRGKQGTVIVDEFAFLKPVETTGDEPPRVALLEAAGSVPAETPNLGRPGIPSREKIALPPLTDPRTRIVVRPGKPLPRLVADVRREQIAAAIAFLKCRGILVTVWDREAEIRKYRVTGKLEGKLHEEVIEIAVAHGFEVPA